MDHSTDELKARLQTDRPHSARVWNYLLGGKDQDAVSYVTASDEVCRQLTEDQIDLDEG
ncbi:SAM-dependent methyltransferase, partial [Streptomyces minutiscleroticus]|uniref:SAM-dependent methyltransferase n=1 Tax=Streptomyces minutiscleroticus TaxID=68238 RepID=UPI0033217CFB